MTALIAELRELVQRIGLISHIGGTSYDGKMARDTSESIGGRRPTGSDVEPRPRDADELAAWLTCYQRRTPAYFSRQLASCHTKAQLQALVDEARETLEAWKRTPIPAGQEPEYGSPQWKRYIADSKEDAGVLATRFFCTRRYINAVRQAMRDGGSMPPEPDRRPQT